MNEKCLLFSVNSTLDLSLLFISSGLLDLSSPPHTHTHPPVGECPDPVFYGTNINQRWSAESKGGVWSYVSWLTSSRTITLLQVTAAGAQCVMNDERVGTKPVALKWAPSGGMQTTGCYCIILHITIIDLL